MSLKWKGEVIPTNKKQKFNNQDVIQIKYNGVEIWHYDNTPPTLVVLGPTGTSSSSPTYTGSSSYVVSGTVSDTESGVYQVTVNGNIATINGSSFSYTLTNLVPNVVTKIDIIAKDNAGNTASITRYLMYDTVAPSISITSSSAQTLSSAYTITGTVSDSGSGIKTVTINGVEVILNNGNFSKNYTLSLGNNTFTVVATDKAGLSSSASIVVPYVNQKDSSSYNWSSTTSSNGNYYVYYNGWYQYYARETSSASSSFTTATARISNTIPLPKGISRMYGGISGGAECGSGYGNSFNCTITLRDNSTGQDLAAVSFNGGTNWRGGDHHEGWGTSSASFDWYLSAEQSMHNLVVIISGSASGTQYTSSSAWVGLSNYAFGWY